MAEEQPIAAGRLGGHALVQEGAKRRDAGAGPDHDDRRRRVRGQAEMLRALHVDFHALTGRGALAEERGSDAEPRALADLVAHRVHRERDAAGIALER